MKYTVALVLICGLAAFHPSTDTPPNELLIESTLDLSVCVSKCVLCNNNKGHELVADTDGPLTTDTHGCEPSDPCDHQSVCQPDFAMHADQAVDQERLRIALLQNRHELIAQLVSSNEAISLNRSRSAVQVMDCTGSVVGHYPLGAASMARVAALTASVGNPVLGE
jgi:hypothetical protein